MPKIKNVTKAINKIIILLFCNIFSWKNLIFIYSGIRFQIFSCVINNYALSPLLMVMGNRGQHEKLAFQFS